MDDDMPHRGQSRWRICMWTSATVPSLAPSKHLTHSAMVPVRMWRAHTSTSTNCQLCAQCDWMNGMKH
ncbi:hypothetical protein BAUCODRAFT_182660 [Baudoinia panamericana UAMH 10762]|uniref:Uncharacterized protein n=1 Tax=Baudoinia panamericana (strain UAMH 10762) TaxID=717646 RepID=M2NML0_BAUPA|nr:uncharacterized protein BAUCODRAFT_182660 [Baudoinia panamericana UAMH 10762]EMD00765.1 hypothetical protein BAUCODRAFT_182660 [Baudoinia panamericana UAMH 10762]